MESGRIFTFFQIDCRFGLPLNKAFVLQFGDLCAAVTLVRELAPLEFVDPANSLLQAPPGSTPPYQLSKPFALPTTGGHFQGLTVTSKDTDLKSPEALKAAFAANASLLVIFEPLGAAVSLRSRLSTEVVIAVEREQSAWQNLKKGELDESHAAIWDEFVRTYHMLTADVRPPFWDDVHRLLIVKQGWVPYGPEAKDLPWAKRVILTSEVPIDRHKTITSYAQEGKFRFKTQEADEVIRRYLRQGEPVPLSRATLAGAQRAVDLHKFGQTAVIESTIALEVAVGEVVTSAKLKGGVSKKKLDDYKNDVGLGYQLNIDLTMILSPLSDSVRTIIGAADAVRKRRNEIVHKGAQATREEGQQAVNAVRALLDLLRSRGYKV